MGACCSQEDDGPQNGLGDSSASEPLKTVPLPPGWKSVPSRSRPGKIAYQNINTGERISWVPTEPAKTYKGAIQKKRKKKKPSSAPKSDSDQSSQSMLNKNGENTSTNGTNGEAAATSSLKTVTSSNTETTQMANT